MRSIIRFVVALVLSITASVAAADVTIVDDPGTHYAYGQFDAPATPDTLNAYLYCELVGATMYCGAGLGDEGPFVFCGTTDPNLKKLLPMVDKSSFLEFFWDDSGTCSRVLVYNNTANLKTVPVPGSLKLPFYPVVNTASQSAYGTVTTTPRTGPNEGVGCEAQSFGQISCQATDSAGNSAFCISSGDSAQQSFADQMLAVSAINESSLISFTWDNTGGSLPVCTSIVVANTSYFLP